LLALGVEYSYPSFVLNFAKSLKHLGESVQVFCAFIENSTVFHIPFIDELGLTEILSNAMDILTIATKVAAYFIPFLFALCFHEFAHGWVAKLRGDRTAEMMGRLTMNPLAHMDMVGTFILPMMAIIFNLPFFFGWAKPVPVKLEIYAMCARICFGLHLLVPCRMYCWRCLVRL
jgi:hypothetical protein